MGARLVVYCLVCLMGSAVLHGEPTGQLIPDIPTPDAIASAPSFAAGEAVVAAHYFYWYKWPGEHFFDGPNQSDTGLRHHFPDHREVDYESMAWYRRQMKDMVDAGVDVALCVYWGAPNQYDKPGLRFSVRGLPPLVAALDDLAQMGDAPRVGLFYDTSTLLSFNAYPKKRDGNVDLRTDEGKRLFYRTIRDFFCLVPPRHWACLDGRPIIQLYGSGFAAGHDQSTLDYVYERFAEDFDGRRPFVVAGPSWTFKADARTGWGASLNGPLLGGDVVQIGPGYDDSPVPGRNSPTRDRLGGGYYRASWLLAIRQRPRLVIIETWSELHEGTGICESLEDGRFYIDLTRHYSDMLKAGRSPSNEDWASTVDALIQARGSKRDGREFAGRITPSARVGADGRLVEAGLTCCPNGDDGRWEVTAVAGTPCVQTLPNVSKRRHLYFDIADPYYYDHSGEITLRFTYFDEGREPILIEYDSAPVTGMNVDFYRRHPDQIERTDTKTWKTAKVVLGGARCANRQNGGADFRLASYDSELAISRIQITKLPEGYGP